MKNDKVGIDDLLEVVSPEMVVGYEKCHSGVFITATNREYKAIVMKGGLEKILSWLFSMLMAYAGSRVSERILPWMSKLLMVFTGACVVVLLLPDGVWKPSVSMIIGLFLVMLVFAWFHTVVIITMWPKNNLDIKKCVSILEEFRESVEGLNPLHMWVPEYNNVSVRIILVTLAVMVLDAEERFDTVRRQKERRTDDVIRCGNMLTEFQANYMKANKYALGFGLHFSNSELFIDARKRIDELKSLTGQ